MNEFTYLHHLNINYTKELFSLFLFIFFLNTSSLHTMLSAFSFKILWHFVYGPKNQAQLGKGNSTLRTSTYL